MRIRRALMRSLAFNLLFYPLSLGAAMAAALAARLGGGRAVRAVLAWWTRRVRGLVRRVLGSRIEIRGRERLPPGGPTLIVAKHQSELDAILLFSLFPHLTAVVMQELERYPFVGRIIKALDMIAVSVDNGPQGRTEAVVAGAVKALDGGRPVLIYPEGTLMSLGAKERYRTGAWRVYAASGATVTPVAQSLGAIWPRREWRKRIGRTGAVEFLDPIAPGLDQETFMAELERRIETATMALIREHADGADLAAAEARYARGAANDD
jgi:1-acyl-sn-glycerol-3-phosphate acyltransferase